MTEIVDGQRIQIHGGTPLKEYLRNIRRQINKIEQQIEDGRDALGEFSEKDLKRMDKAICVMKVGAKITKKVLKSRKRRESHPAATQAVVIHAPGHD